MSRVGGAVSRGLASGRALMLLAVTASALVCAGSLQAGNAYALALATPVCLTVALAATLLVASSAKTRLAPSGVGALCIAVIGVVGIAVPAQQLVDGERNSILGYLGVYSGNVISTAPRAVLVYLLCLCSFAVVELLPLRLPARKDPSTSPRWESPALYWSLLGVGMLSTLALGSTVSAAGLEERGQTSGQGIAAVVQQCLLLAIACGVANRHWGMKLPAVASALAMAFSLSFTSARSGLLFIVVALGVRWMRGIREKGLGAGLVAAFAALAYGASVFIVGFAQWRAAFRQTGRGNVLTYLFDASSDPIGRLSSEGALDTFDGLVLSLNVDRHVVGATVLDPLRGVLNLVPSQIWDDKPGYLAPEVTHYYTLFGGQSGLFLSGAGYSYIVGAGLLGACIFFFCLALLFRWLSARYWHSPIITAILLYSLLRFIIGGDSFDFQYGLTLVLSVLAGRALVAAARGLHGVIREPDAPTLPPAVERTRVAATVAHEDPGRQSGAAHDPHPRRTALPRRSVP